jgi:hypothetical protein
MIASSGHTMEYVGSGTDYRALPENGGVPIESRQITELNNGKVWAATTDHKGKFALGSFFTVDQNTGVITMETGSIKLDLNTLLVTGTGYAQLGAPLDMNGNEISDESGDLQLDASGDIDVQTNKIKNVGTPAASTDAATKGYVDTATTGMLTSSDIGSTVQGYDAGLAYLDGLNFTDETTFKQGVNLEIGVDVQAYDVNTAKLDAATSNFTGTLQNGGSDVVVDTDIGSTVQAYDADNAVTDAAQTFTAAQRGEITTLTSATTITPDFADSNNFTCTLGHNATIANPTNLTAGQSGSIFLVQDGTGSRTAAWGSYWDFAGGTAPVLTTAASSVDRVDYVVRTTGSIHAVATLNLS